MEYIDLINSSQDIFKTIQNISIDNLEKVIIYASDKYYNDEPVISDAIFDMLRDFLQYKHPKSKVLKQIGAPVKSKDKVKLPYYLGSMDKIKPPSSKLEQWITKYNLPYIMSDKLDGVSALLVYKNNNINLYTRGTATHGMDITPLLRYIKSIPSYESVMKYLKEHKMGDMIAFRGELIISKKKFIDNWYQTMKNARNAVAGLVNSKNINPKLARDTSLVLYQIIDPVYNITKQFQIIKDLGFKLVHNKTLKILNFDNLSKYLLKRREKSKYTIDGIIITNDDIHPINTDGNPEYAWAFKDVLEDQKAITKIIDIEWNTSKDGYIIPTLIVEPVDVGGVTISRITGNNARFIVDNMLGIGAKVEIIRSNDVIPKIEKVIEGVKVKLPDMKNISWNISNIHLIYFGNFSEQKDIKNIYYFFKTIGAKGIGEQIIEKLYEAGYDSILKILKLTQDDIIKIDGFKIKSAQNIIEAIKNATTNIPLYILMAASNKLGRGIGIERIKDVLEKYPNLLNEYNKYTENELINMLRLIDGFEEKTSKLFATNFKNFITFYNNIKNYITIDTSTSKKETGKLSGLKIVMSGFRDKVLENTIEKNGGSIASGVSKNTNILIVKDDSVMNTTKVIKAQELGVTIYTLNNFYKHYKL